MAKLACGVNVLVVTIGMGNFSRAFYLWRNNAPAGVIGSYLMTACRRSFRRKHANAVTELQRFARDNDFEHDWFSGNVPFWLEIFESYGLRGRPIRAMEIGSFEGLSACFILQELPEALLTCVDTWDGSDEHVGMRRVQSIEAAFDKNIAPWRDRVTKHKSNSLGFLASLGAQDKFDFIYVDGSHHADDVMIDAIRSFEQLKVGGVMIMDDYLWRYYPRSSEDPARAISGFLRLAEGRFKLIMTYRQLALVKTAERSV